MNKNKLNTPPEIIVTACVSAGLSTILSLTNIVLCVLALIFRYDCDVGDLANSTGADFFLVTIAKLYVQDETCAPLHLEDLTKVHSVFILTVLILVFAVINLVASIALISVVIKEDGPAPNLDIITYVYVGACLASLVVDLTLGVHFGMDYQTVTDLLSKNSPGLLMNYQLDMIRLGAFLLMTIALKGFVGYAMSIVLLILLVSYIVDFQQKIQENEHPIHKLGVLNAFDSDKRYEDPWNARRHDVFMRGSSLNQPLEEEPHHVPMRANPLNQENTNNPKRVEDPWNLHRNDMFMGYPRGPQVNPAFNDDEPPRAPIKENPLSDYRNNKRPDTWLHGQNSPGPGLGSRPFSYLEEPKRPIPVKPPTTPTNEPQWRRDAWPPAPPVPDPDYSPPPRRLKSALKSNYP
ncbi:uncharacterized protein LOC125075811 [Vanessa atalanta]|uniref:uncharacterized protein LOC125075811 n=1 Tax=Vanessa atalanta TaxID=42275 RepID=UPI001FCDDA3C|nr:uncharacterized protein LOC125075811 [Vanessa atalanta]